jgi:hypothetical protein
MSIMKRKQVSVLACSAKNTAGARVETGLEGVRIPVLRD